jgi:ABC-type branched-subunit amino acid transport system ATPase component
MTGLEARGVRVCFGAVEAVRGVDVTVPPGRIVGLIGPNGAGKTTLVDALMGFVPLAAGEVTLDGRSISSLAPHERAAAGVTRTFQTVELFDDLTVAENLQVAGEAGRRRTVGAPAQPAVRLDVRPEQLPAQLGPSGRKTVALARALACRPRVLLLDEPAAGLDRAERGDLVEALRGVAATGTGVLLVDHDLQLVLDVCDEVVVLDLGEVVFAGSPTQLRGDERVATAYLGAVATSTRRRGPAPASARRAVVAEGLRISRGHVPVLHAVDMHVDEGEVVAVLGPNGAGKTTLLMALCGLLRVSRGALAVLRTPVPRRPHQLARRGVATVLQETRLFADLTVADNLRLAGGKAAVARSVERFPDIEPLLRKRGGDLSGGQQQLAALARAIARRPRLLIVDELSLGLSAGAVDRLLTALVEVSRDDGTAVVFAEQHAHHALAVADRAYVLSAGTVALEGRADELAADPQRLAAAYLGSLASRAPREDQ